MSGGFCPEGYTKQAAVQSAQVAVDKNWKEMLQTPIFYVMIILLTCGAFSGMMIISQAAGLAQEMVGMTKMAASTAVSVLALLMRQDVLRQEHYPIKSEESIL